MTKKLLQNTRFSAVLILLAPLLLFGCVSDIEENSNSRYSTTAYQLEKKSKIRKKNVDGAPKNVIVFIGDGMGVTTLTAGRIFVGQEMGKFGEEHELSWDKFNHLALIKTYNTNAQVPDSAGTATAILSGYKTNIGAINVRPDKNLQKMFLEGCGGETLPTLTDKAKSQDKSVGIISTARLTHATPAAMYSHSASRRIEANKDLKAPFDYKGCKSISQQLVESDVDLALGGGRKEFTQSQLGDWNGALVQTKAEMLTAPSNRRLLGLFTSSHMAFDADRDDTLEPSLAQMTNFAIDRLSSNAEGYVMMIEAGRIDHAHHGTNAYRALKDLQALDNAVSAAVARAGDDTLILVTADHSHAFTFSGYPVRGNPILGLARSIDPETGDAGEDYNLDENGKPYTTLGYQNGPNIRKRSSKTLTDDTVQSPDYKQQTAVNLASETHGGDDVALFAYGPGADRFKGVMEQDEIGQILGDLLGQ